jgi:hypothetical protein
MAGITGVSHCAQLEKCLLMVAIWYLYSCTIALDLIGSLTKTSGSPKDLLINSE